MATLNFPAWSYVFRYRHGLFKQLITKKGQEEVAEDWLVKFNPWEIVRHDVVFPARFFFGNMQINPNGSRKWVSGDVVQALAYDVQRKTESVSASGKQKLEQRILTFFSSKKENMNWLHSSIIELNRFALYYIQDMLRRMGNYYG